MLGSITLFLVFQLAGEVIALALGLPVPGPVIGLVLLFAALVLRGAIPDPIRDTANNLLQHLSLLFVPAGVGVVVHAATLRDQWFPIVIALIVSTALTIAITALVLDRLAQRRDLP